MDKRDDTDQSGAEARPRRQQPARIGVERVREQRDGVLFLDQAATVHDADALAHVGDDAQVVADKQHRRPLGPAQLVDELEDARLHEGWLQAWGSPGEGSCFRLTLPRRPGQPIGRSPLPLAPDDSQVGRVMPAGNSLTLGTNSGSQT